MALGSTKAPNLLAFGPPGIGKSHLAAALGQTLIENGYRVLFTRTTDMVQRQQAARLRNAAVSRTEEQAAEKIVTRETRRHKT